MMILSARSIAVALVLTLRVPRKVRGPVRSMEWRPDIAMLGIATAETVPDSDYIRVRVVLGLGLATAETVPDSHPG